MVQEQSLHMEGCESRLEGHPIQAVAPLAFLLQLSIGIYIYS